MNLSKDLAMKISLELNIDDIVSLCKTSKFFNYYVCQNDSFWLNKILKDFPNVKNIKNYGNNYREIYKNISEKKEIFIEVNIKREFENEDGEELEEEAEINLGFNFIYYKRIPIEDLKKIIINGFNRFFQGISLFGMYDIYIDEKECLEAKGIYMGCFDFFNSETKLIKINLDSQENIDESDQEDYQEYLEESFSNALKNYI